MSGFTTEWLKLREPCDTRARSEDLVRALHPSLQSRPIQAVDLGTGTGANIRFMAPILAGEQRWLAVDDDPAMLERQDSALQGANFHCVVVPRQLNLATDLKSLPLSGKELVTGSALLDLVSAHWLEALASSCALAGASVLFALNYDGRVHCLPEEPDDAWILGLINQHQRGDKGFGPALGPDATLHACAIFAASNFRWRTAASDWLIEPQEQALQRELIAGWVAAACEIAPADEVRIKQWGRVRTAHLEAGISHICVGHQDFMASPTTPDG